MPKRVTFFTGAGISAESGVPTFRTGPDALWENHRVEDVCHIDTFERNYDLVHRFYNQRRTALAGVQPNAAHHAIAELQNAYPGQVRLMTTNVDDLHERAGSRDLRHIHGNLLEMVNLASGEVFPLDYIEFDHVGTAGRFKPNVVFFGEVAPVYAELFELMDSLDERDLVVVVGSSELVIPFCAQAWRGSLGQARILYVDPCEESPYQGLRPLPYQQHYQLPATAALEPGSETMREIQVWLEGGT